MSGKFSRFSLPLLLKELIEQSARRRLFVTRVVYALVLFFLAAAFMLPMIYQQLGTPIGFLGIGRHLFQTLLMLQFLGIYLFLPALASGVITIEKERNTLALLFLTKLTPWNIIFEKFGSRLVPMLSLLLTSLPLLAFTYSMGGIQTFDLVCGLWFLVLSLIQVTSFAILASAFFRSTVAAFLATYALVSVIGFGFIVLDELVLNKGIWNSFANIGQTELAWLFEPGHGLRLGFLVRGIFLPPALSVMCASEVFSPGPQAVLFVLLCGLPSLLSAVMSLALARVYLVRRAFLAPANPLLNVFQSLDRLFVWSNKRFTRGIVLVRESQTLPDLQPVAWRETEKRSLGQFRYLVRILLVLEFPVLVFILLAANDGSANRFAISGILTLTWICVALILSTSAATLFSRERGRQTLDVLLTSPLSSRQIIQEKLSGVWRVMFVCAIPLLTCVIFQTWWREQLYFSWSDHVRHVTNGYRTRFYLWPEYLVGGVLTIIIYMNLIAWLSLWLGIRTTSPTRAILGSVGAIVAWCSIPAAVFGSMVLYLMDLPDIQRELSNSGVMLGFLSSPLLLIALLEAEGICWLHPMPYLAVILNSLLYGSCWLLIRRHVLRHADHYLGRIPTHKPGCEPIARMETIDAAELRPQAAPVMN